MSAVPSTTTQPVEKSKEQLAAELKAAQKKFLDAEIKKHGNKSGVIRALTAEGKKVGDIARLTGIRYQHVRNVRITPVKNPVRVQPAA